MIPDNFVGNDEGEEYIFDRNDEIFTLSMPTTKQRIPTNNCSFCKKEFNKRAERHFCEFCALQMCTACKRERRFPMVAAKYAAQRARGKCCKMCVKKFDIRAMINSAEADHEKLRPVIEEKLKLYKEKERDRVRENPES